MAASWRAAQLAPALLLLLAAAQPTAAEDNTVVPQASSTRTRGKWLVFQIMGSASTHSAIADSSRRLMNHGFELAWVHCQGSAPAWRSLYPDVVRRLFWFHENGDGQKFDLWLKHIPGLLHLGWERVWIMDDDITTLHTDLDLLRKQVLSAGLAIMQPAVRPLEEGGRSSDHPHLRIQEQRPELLYTNLVEVQLPILKVSALKAILGPPMYGRRTVDCFWCGWLEEALPDPDRECACGVLPAAETAVTHHDKRSAGWSFFGEDWGTMMNSVGPEVRRHNVCPGIVNGTKWPRRKGAWPAPCKRRQVQLH
eukprot:TRINITY_DN5779_c0_g1_i1.p1 TRINITY_DN5779_c0_g1~~TRINITY_DN5779_c0_g1_i1.p1  ORF type:complete len:336 (+),score=88.50 TRINITY_DN5779_c0_g1_i1:83-1009(+)